MLSEILSKKGYRFFRGEPFIDREEEIKFLVDFFEKEPSRILFLCGPKSTGKTTLIEYVIENELFNDFKLFKSKKYNVKYINFRRKLISSYKSFIDSLVTKEDKSLDEKLSASINLAIFKLNSEVFEKVKEKEIDLFDALIDEFKKSIIIDEI
jgi:AAA+ ATPase superfamily predicted ATPase